MPTIGSRIATFSSLLKPFVNAPQTNESTVVASGGKLVITNTNIGAGFQGIARSPSGDTWADGERVFVRLESITAGRAYLLINDVNNQYYIEANFGSTIKAFVNGGLRFTGAAYSSVTHKWFAFKRVGTTVYWQTSALDNPDPLVDADWTTLYSNPESITGTGNYIDIGQVSTGAGGTSTFDNVNWNGLGAVATQLVFATQPVGTESPIPMAIQPIVEAQRPDNTLDPSYVGNVTFALIALTGDPSLSGTLVEPLINGKAEPTDLAITATVNSTWRLTATLAPLTVGQSNIGNTTPPSAPLSPGAWESSTALLPGARFDALKAWGDVMPTLAEFAAIIAAGRSVTVANNADLTISGNNLQTAVDAVKVMVGGTRLVILNDNFVCRKNVLLGLNADLNYDIIIAWSRVVDGTFPITRWIRTNETPHVNAPKIQSAVDVNDATAQSYVISTTKHNDVHRWRMFGCNVRVWSGASKTSYCQGLFDHGLANDLFAVGFTAATALTTARYFQFSHGWFGGVKFDAAGEWRVNNLGRAFLDSSRGLMINDSWDTEHGAQLSNGSDRGIWGSSWAQGPVYLSNIATDSGGGIAWMHGGSDIPATFPNCEDFKIDYVFVHWHPRYSPAGLTSGYTAVPQDSDGRLPDSLGNYCPWARKNQGEIKTGYRHWWHRCVYKGFWGQGQANAIGIKSTNQDGGVRSAGVRDFTFTESIVDVFAGNAIALIGGEGYNFGFVEGLDGLNFQRNYFKHGGKGIGVTVRAASVTLTTPARNWVVANNLQDSKDPTAYSSMFSEDAGVESFSGTYNHSRNVVAVPMTLPPTVQGAFGGEYGYGPYFARTAFNASVTAIKNYSVNSVNQGLDVAGVYTDNTFVATQAALGLYRRTNGILGHRLESVLHTAGPNGSLVGPQLWLISQIYDAVQSGDVRALVAQEGGVVAGGSVVRIPRRLRP